MAPHQVVDRWIERSHPATPQVAGYGRRSLHRRIMSFRIEAAMPGLKVLQKSEGLHEARWWEAEPGGKVHCYLCPRHRHIGEGQAGF
jgi:hypothetical protein